MNIQTAVHYAKKYHTNLYAGQPYIYHVLQVTLLLHKWRRNYSILNKTLKDFSVITDKIIIVGWLHDILEDTECTYEELELEFGKDIASHVKKLSKNYYSNDEQYLDTVKNDIVKIADTTCNFIEALKNKNKSRIKKYASQLCTIAGKDFYFSIVSDYVDSLKNLSMWAYDKHVEKQ